MLSRGCTEFHVFPGDHVTQGVISSESKRDSKKFVPLLIICTGFHVKMHGCGNQGDEERMAPIMRAKALLLCCMGLYVIGEKDNRVSENCGERTRLKIERNFVLDFILNPSFLLVLSL